ncbi:FtsB family cell division protein [Niabella beijingensis]|uniref:FtsB family cell division protein n=1 Tax=Niabella beijingensis TaxID=2872700 RepID=UPI001CBFA8D5|nr:septum formation initiator family protein [Niabella beijingensis]MBZ4188422.1 septum formation initiator family protein [Niabella beijingensis]
MEEFVDFVPEKEPAQEAAPRRPRKALSRISRFLTNKFFLATIGFLAIMLFLDKNDLFSIMERRKELNDLELSKDHYNKELIELHRIKNDLETDPATIEKLAREKYLMKRDNEDIFLTEDNNTKLKQAE